MNNNVLEIKDELEIKEEVIQEFDPTNFIFDDEQLNYSRDGSSGEINEADISLSSNEESEKTVKHVCSKCNTAFQSRTNLEKHWKFCCVSSEYHLRKTEMLKNLEQIEEDAAIMETKNMCFCCEESYDLESFHIGQIKCIGCLKSFKSHKSYDLHFFITHSELNDFPCTICSAKLRSESFLKLHVNQHQKFDKLYVCTKCNKNFNCPEHLERHQMMSMCSQKDAPLKCKECKKAFIGLDNIRAHIRSDHSGTQYPRNIEFMCPICKKFLSSPFNLKVHARLHTGECPFACDLCDKKFRLLESMKRHRRQHTGEMPYECEECHRKFGSTSNLSYHKKQHTGERPYVCSVCEKSFVSKSQLNKHLKIHMKKPYIKCEICNGQFNAEKDLENHRKVIHGAGMKHRKSADFKCRVCLDPFGTKHDFDKHKERGCTLKNNKKRTYNLTSTHEKIDCVICNKKFETYATLRYHLTMVHKVDPEDYINVGTNIGGKIGMEPQVYKLEEKNKLKTTNTGCPNNYNSVVISSIIYKCESNSSNEIILDTCIDNINSVDEDGNDLEKNLSNEHEFNINTYSSNDDDGESGTSFKKFKYEDDSSEEVKLNINTDRIDSVDNKIDVVVQEFKVDEMPSTSLKTHSVAKTLNCEFK